MSTSNSLQQGFNSIITKAGTQVRLKYYSQGYDDVYDDSVTLVQSGADLWTSGIVLAISSGKGQDNLLLEQGKLTNSDKKLFLNGSLLLTGNKMQVKFMIGSPGYEYSILPDGTSTHEVEGQTIYTKVYLRRLTGSLIGE